MKAIQKLFDKDYKKGKMQFKYKIARQIVVKSKKNNYNLLYLSFNYKQSLINQFIYY